MNIELSLEVSKEHNLKIMRLFDTTNFCDTEIENYLIEVLPAKSLKWVTFNVNPGFSLILNSSNLKYKVVSDVSQLTDIPDGIYEIKQSYKPNTATVVQFYHLRTIALNLKYVELLCRHFSEEYKKDKNIYTNEILHLTKIKQYIDAAEYAVSEKHDKDLGIKFYNQATELIKQYDSNRRCL